MSPVVNVRPSHGVKPGCLQVEQAFVCIPLENSDLLEIPWRRGRLLAISFCFDWKLAEVTSLLFCRTEACRNLPPAPPPPRETFPAAKQCRSTTLPQSPFPHSKQPEKGPAGTAVGEESAQTRSSNLRVWEAACCMWGWGRASEGPPIQSPTGSCRCRGHSSQG